MDKPVIILGQGLAGTVLAFKLHKLGVAYKIFDDGNESSSTKVAAGLWNPVVFRKLNKSWMADALIPELFSFYKWVERLLDVSFFHSIDLTRAHSSLFEQNLWMEKKDSEEFSKYLGEPDSIPEGMLEGEYGISTVHKTGFVNLTEFLSQSRLFFEMEGKYEVRKIIDSAIFDDYSGNRIIDCRGYKSAFSDWWGFLPFALTKGEVITIECPNLNLRKIFNAGFFVCPIGENRFRVGATFNWDDKDEIPTDHARKELQEKLEKRLKLPYKIIDHRAGVRPTVKDRRPLIGRHPEIRNLFLFNGLGTKGVMIAPYLADNFLDYLLNNKDIIPDADLNRFV